MSQAAQVLAVDWIVEVQNPPLKFEELFFCRDPGCCASVPAYWVLDSITDIVEYPTSMDIQE